MVLTHKKACIRKQLQTLKGIGSRRDATNKPYTTQPLVHDMRLFKSKPLGAQLSPYTDTLIEKRVSEYQVSSDEHHPRLFQRSPTIRDPKS